MGTLRVSRGHAKEEAFVSPGIETMLHRQKLEAAGSSVILIHGQHYRYNAKYSHIRMYSCRNLMIVTYVSTLSIDV